MSGATPAEIAVGATASDGDLRLCLARLAVEKGEALLAAQIDSVGRIASSGSAILGWTVTISLALGAAISSAQTAPNAGNLPALPGTALLPAVIALVPMLASAACCIIVLWPGSWSAGAQDPQRLLDARLPTELEVLEDMAVGYAGGVARNAVGLNDLQRWLRLAWLLFASAPFCGGVAYAISIAR